MSFSVSWSKVSEISVASLSGRIDSGNSVECADALRAGIRDDDRSLVLNLSGVDYVSSAGLRVMLMMAKKFTGPGQAFGICGLTPGVSEVFSMSGFADIIAIHDSQDAAIAAIAGEAPPPEPAAGAPSQGGVALKSSIDMDIVGDNLSEIARFTIEKHEFSNPDLSEALREKAYTAITEVLWDEAERIMQRRNKILAGLFESAAATLEKVLADADR